MSTSALFSRYKEYKAFVYCNVLRLNSNWCYFPLFYWPLSFLETLLKKRDVEIRGCIFRNFNSQLELPKDLIEPFFSMCVCIFLSLVWCSDTNNTFTSCVHDVCRCMSYSLTGIGTQMRMEMKSVFGFLHKDSKLKMRKIE